MGSWLPSRSLWVLSMCAFWLWATSAEAMTLIEALSQSYMTNPTIAAERAKLRSIDEEVPEALSNWRPTLSLSASNGFSQQRVTGGTQEENQFYSGQAPPSSYSVNLTEQLYRGGRTEAETNGALADVHAETAKLLSTEQSVLLQVATDYLNIIEYDEEVGAAADNQHFLEEKFLSAKAEILAGAMSKIDVAEADAAYEQSIVDRKTAEAKALGARRTFMRDVGVEPGKVEYTAIQFALPGNEAEVSELADANNYDVRYAKAKLESATFRVKDIYGQALPQLSAEASAQHIDGASFQSERENVLTAMLHLTIPLYSGGAVESQTRAAEQEVVMYRSQVDQARAAAEADASIAWLDMKAQLIGIQANDAEIKANMTALRGLIYQLQGGEKTILDVLNAQQLLFKSKVSLIQARHDELLAEFRLAGALGQANARSLHLDVPYYNPDDYLNQEKNRWFGFSTDK
jgi:outer membrane protein